MLYYVVLIAFGMAIFAAAGLLSYFLLFHLLPVAYRDIRMDILIVAVTIGVWLLAFTLGAYLVRPLFSFRRNEKEGRVEIQAAECPELFAMIRDVAGKTGCRMPAHVYLTAEVNACVFYNTSFWSIFLPVRKNLEIGLGLFDGTSIAELKSVIAHEFGHFSQSSMKVGSTVHVANTVLSNLILTDDSWDRWLDNWVMSDTGTVRRFGIVARGMTNVIKRLTLYMFMFVQKGYLNLSRQMEYDADSIACRCAGSDAFISALCKTEVLSSMDRFYVRMLQALVLERKMVADYFEGKDATSGIVHSWSRTMPKLAFDMELKEPVRLHTVHSRVSVENVWESHPSLEDRIANARAVNAASVSGPLPSGSLIPENIAGKVSAVMVSMIRNSAEEELACIPVGEFEEWARMKVDETFIDERLRVFFGGAVFEFDLDSARGDALESPFTEENAMKMARFAAALNDWRILEQVMNKEIKAREIQIDGKVYKRRDIPFEEFKTELDSLRTEVREIHSRIYAYVRGNCDGSLAETLDSGFLMMFRYNRIVQESLPSLLSHRDALVEELNRPVRRNEEEYGQLCAEVREYELHVREMISGLDADECVKEIKEYMDEIHNPAGRIDVNAVNSMLLATESISTHARLVLETARRQVCKVVAGVLDMNVTASGKAAEKLF